MGFGTWEAVPEGTFLEATRTTSLASSNNKHSAGLPNITGDFSVYTYPNSGGTGVFKFSTPSGSGSQLPWGNATGQYARIDIDASKDGKDTIFGKSTTVQPKSQLTYAYRRTS